MPLVYKVGLFSLCCLLLFFGLASCQNHSLVTSVSDCPHKLRVLCTTSMITDLVKEVGGEFVETNTLIYGEMDPHSYEIVKGDDEKISAADLIFSNGLGLEHGASLRHRLSMHPHFIALGDEIYKNHHEKMIIHENQLDPHIWMDVALWSECLDFIAEALCEQDPEHEINYTQQSRRFKNEMLKAHAEIRTLLLSIPENKRYLVTSHDAFNYFARAYLNASSEVEGRVQAPEGLAPDGQLSSADIQRIIDYLCAHRVGVVFSESNVSKDALKKIVSCCAEKDLNVRIASAPLYGDAMGASSYLKMMRHNAEVLYEHWQAE